MFYWSWWWDALSESDKRWHNYCITEAVQAKHHGRHMQCFLDLDRQKEKIMKELGMSG